MKKALFSLTQATGTISASTGGPANPIGRARTIGVQCNITGSGTGTIQLQKSNDGVNWVAEGTAVSVPGGTTTLWLEKVDPTAAYMRVFYTVSTGSFASSTIFLAQGDV